MRVYQSSRRMAEEYADELSEENGADVSMIEAVDLALFSALTMVRLFEPVDRFEQDHPGFGNEAND